MDIKYLKEKLKFIDSKKFPVEECIKKDLNEDFIYESEKEYLTMIYDKDFDIIEFLIGKPYIYKKNKKILYGWSHSGKHIGNEYKPVKDYGELVIGYKEVPNAIQSLNDFINEIVNEENMNHVKDVEYILKEIFGDLFIVSNIENFPDSECIEEEFNVLNGTKKYLCLIYDLRFDNSLIIRELYPYKFLDKEENKYLYGWTTKKKKDNFTDNMINSAHGNCWDEYVIAFSK